MLVARALEISKIADGGMPPTMRRCTEQKAKFDKIFKGASVHDPRGSVGFGVVCDKAIFHLAGSIRRNGAWADVSFLVPASRKDGEQVRTVTVALQMFIGENGIDWGLLMAGGTLVGLPATVLFCWCNANLSVT
jgi:hypothetical protein